MFTRIEFMVSPGDATGGLRGFNVASAAAHSFGVLGRHEAPGPGGKRRAGRVEFRAVSTEDADEESWHIMAYE